MTLAYRMNLNLDDNDTILVTVPALPEVTTFAATPAEAPRLAANAIEEALAGRIARAQDTPPSDGHGVSLPLLTELKVGLYAACRAQAVTRAELVRRLGWNRESVDRLFRLDHASKLSQIEAAYRALGLVISASVQPVLEEVSA